MPGVSGEKAASRITQIVRVCGGEVDTIIPPVSWRRKLIPREVYTVPGTTLVEWNGQLMSVKLKKQELFPCSAAPLWGRDGDCGQ